MMELGRRSTQINNIGGRMGSYGGIYRGEGRKKALGIDARCLCYEEL